MAAIGDDISDRDLRAKLKEYGISVGPITASTKGLYIRKLNKKLTGAEDRLNSSVKKPSKKSLSPRKSPSRSPARADNRRSLGATPPPQRKLVGFSSDEEDAPKETVVRNSKRVSGRFSPSSSAVTHSTRFDEERPLLRFRKPFDKYSTNVSQNEEKTELDGRVGVPRNYHEFKHSAAKLSPYSGLRQLFMRKSMEDSKKNTPQSENTQAESSYDVGTNNGKKRSYFWLVLLLCILVILAFINWQYTSVAFLWNGQQSSSLKICGPNSSENELDVCTKKEDFVKLLLDQLVYELGIKNGLIDCGYLPKDSKMTKNDLENWISRRVKDKQFPEENILEDVFKQGQNKSDDGLRFLNGTGALATSPEDFVSVEMVRFVLKPLSCRIREAFSKVFWQLVIFSAVVVLSLAFYFFVKYRWMMREKRTRQMFELVDQILEVLKSHHQECQHNKDLSPYLAIPHVRDMLIKPSERESMKPVWELAVKFLSAKDSRVRVESQRIAGEDFEVWRLLHHGSPSSPQLSSTPNSKEEKVWQGQAFEDFQSAVNPPLISPTPCLKIRNMFEPVMETREKWHVFIQDAILEKCNEKGAAIVHIAVDQSSNEGCVYVKCANHRSSGAAFRAIHGCWFDGRLVTVKFLTLKRYHQRFPEAMMAKEPIKPSGTSSSTIPKLKSEPVNESDSDSESEEPVVT